MPLLLLMHSDEYVYSIPATNNTYWYCYWYHSRRAQFEPFLAPYKLIESVNLVESWLRAKKHSRYALVTLARQNFPGKPKALH
jgi:hypothetical protein